MILVGNQRGGAKDLAQHLLKVEENDHVEVHALRGFASDNLNGALNEAYAVSRATRCSRFLYSLSLNPPPDQNVSTADFEAAIDRAENELGLNGQPRAIVFHEKAGADGLPRRHAHAVWSRIKADEMKAVHMSKDREKLMEVSRELYREHGWKMPRGMMKSEERDPRNFSLEEWQQAKRAKRDPREIKGAIQDCWAISDSRAAFEHALQERGFKLARGDRRGFVAVDMHGEPYAVARYAGVRTKQVRERLGELEPDYPGIEKRKEQFAAEIGNRLHELRHEEDRKAAQERERQEIARKSMVERQREERAARDAAMKDRWEREAAARQARFNRGWRGLIDHFSGRLKRIREQNMAESYQAVLRDRAEKDALIFRHMEERRELLARHKAQQHELSVRRRELDTDIRARAEFSNAVQRSPSQPRSSIKSESRAPPTPSAKMDFTKASVDEKGDDREARRQAFLETRKAQSIENPHDRQPDIER
ncbi:relaxase/mobilization nuclease domain-containing protein [Novosphingobium beihaiensis]|uniref:Relaxase n=1 Tax=Novosphingobium beihaiensis TaxID=2930389 RepID=A0ABT0BS41_9SPHN|nr:relaxase [Novosphingobium beihaiensis]MCJ2187877.1 relaxase [Novosphingobium beihaiensis]